MTDEKTYMERVAFNSSIAKMFEHDNDRKEATPEQSKILNGLIKRIREKTSDMSPYCAEFNIIINQGADILYQLLYGVKWFIDLPGDQVIGYLLPYYRDNTVQDYYRVKVNRLIHMYTATPLKFIFVGFDDHVGPVPRL